MRIQYNNKYCKKLITLAEIKKDSFYLSENSFYWTSISSLFHANTILLLSQLTIIFVTVFLPTLPTYDSSNRGTLSLGDIRSKTNTWPISNTEC